MKHLCPHCPTDKDIKSQEALVEQKYDNTVNDFDMKK